MCGGIRIWYEGLFIPGIFEYSMYPSPGPTPDVPGGLNSAGIIQYESPSNHDHEGCLPRRTAYDLSRPRASISSRPPTLSCLRAVIPLTSFLAFCVRHIGILRFVVFPHPVAPSVQQAEIKRAFLSFLYVVSLRREDCLLYTSPSPRDS